MWERLLSSWSTPATQAATTDTTVTPQLVNEKEGDKPDYLDVDGDGDKTESMKDALEDKKNNDDGESELDKSESEESHNESVDYYIEQTLKDCQALGRERWFRTNWRRDRALLENMATGDAAADAPFENWSQEDFWKALVGVEREFYGL